MWLDCRPCQPPPPHTLSFPVPSEPLLWDSISMDSADDLKRVGQSLSQQWAHYPVVCKHCNSSYFMYMSILPACMCTTHFWCPWRSEEVQREPLGLQMVDSCHVGTRNRTWILHKNSQGPYHCAVSPVPKYYIF